MSLRASGDAELNTDRFGDPKLVETDNAAQMAEQIGIEDQMFKLHFVDGEGDSVLVSTHTEIDDLLNCASITARLEPAVEQ